MPVKKAIVATLNHPTNITSNIYQRGNFNYAKSGRHVSFMFFFFFFRLKAPHSLMEAVVGKRVAKKSGQISK